ncbi:MAG: ATP-binding protein [Lentisphaeraceae bacterium]|nr:ATP-binding protein [Lentisphaeraceae bacterium]
MKKRGSIKNKLISANLMTVIIAFIIVGIIVVLNLNSLSSTFMNMSEERSNEVSENLKVSSEQNIQKIQKFFEKSLYDKGRILLERDSLVLKPLFLDNSFNGVRNLLTNLYKLDDEILSLSFFTVEGEDEVKAWAFLNRQYISGLGLKTVYDVEKGVWNSDFDGKKVSLKDLNVKEIINNGKKEVKLIDYNLTTADGTSKQVKAYQCTVPIFEGEDDEFKEFREDGEPVGFLRYVLTLEKMQEAVLSEKALLEANQKKQEEANVTAAKQTSKAGEESLTKSLTNLALGAVVVLVLSFFLAVIVGNKVSNPILELKASAQVISQGDYSQPVTVESNDEIGVLSHNFEEMRCQVKEFTENLQELVDEKTKEISDILNSIEQGIFTVNKDLSINEQHSSKAEDIYGITEFASSNLKDMFKISDQKVEQFQTWITLISNPKKLKRWKKYAELAPVSELVQEKDGEERIIQVDYRPITTADGELSKLMVLSRDVTEERKVKAALEKTKREQQLTLQRVIGLINNDQESLKTFFEGYEHAIESLKKVDYSNFPKEQIDELFREVHTVKGNGGSFGFNEVSRAAGFAEDFLEDAKSIDEFTDEHKDTLTNALKLMEEELEGINAMKAKLFSGEEDSMSISRVQFQELLTSVQDGMLTDVKDIAKKLFSLDLNPFDSFCRKYANIVTSYRESYGKDVKDLNIINPTEMIHRDTMKKFDMAAVHLVRNSLDHGLESNDERDASGKGSGTVSMELQVSDDSVKMIVGDDGKGINGEIIASKAVEKGLITDEEKSKLSDQEKIELIFHPGFSTNDEVTDVSGRGVGMDAVKSSIEELNGKVEIETELGKGTKMILTLPV